MYTVFQDFLYQVFTEVSGIPWRFSHVKFRRQFGLFGIIHITSGALRPEYQPHQDEKVFYDEEEKVQIIGSRKYFISLSTYGSGALNKLTEIEQARDTYRMREIFEKNERRFNLSAYWVNNASGINDLTAVFRDDFEERGNLDVTFVVKSVQEESLPYVRDVQIEKVN